MGPFSQVYGTHTVPVREFFPRKMIRSIQARNTATTPICHCQFNGQLHGVTNTNAKKMAHMYKMTSIQLTRSLT